MNSRDTAGKKLLYYLSLQDESKARKVELFEQATWDFWSRKTWVKFMYVYADNAFNKRHNRVGKIAGFRIGTRNLDLIPAADKPRARGTSRVKRYYDVTRAGTTVAGGLTSGGLRGKVTSNSAQPGQWRSFRPDTFSIMVSIWSFEKQAWVDKLSDFNDRSQNSG